MPEQEAAAGETLELFASKEQVNDQIGEMAAEVIDKYAADNPLFVCFMRGAVQFTAKFMHAIRGEAEARNIVYHPEVDYMTISTYKHGRQAGEPKIIMDLDTPVHDRTVVMLDDVLDTGNTMEFADRYFSTLGARVVRSCVLVEKENERARYQRGADVFGFRSPGGLWLRGMGMDDSKAGTEFGRWDEHISIVRPAA